VKKKISIPTLKCEKCNYQWIPRVADVRQCPKCKSVRWDKPKVKNEDEKSSKSDNNKNRKKG
jgi:predicted Zn-ribbon and HTH transcriptional regulator